MTRFLMSDCMSQGNRPDLYMKPKDCGSCKNRGFNFCQGYKQISFCCGTPAKCGLEPLVSNYSKFVQFSSSHRDACVMVYIIQSLCIKIDGQPKQHVYTLVCRKLFALDNRSVEVATECCRACPKIQ